MILTDEEIDAVFDRSREDTFEQALRSVDFARSIEAAIVKKLHKQVRDEICFKMSAGSPNRQRIHELIDGWLK